MMSQDTRNQQGALCGGCRYGQPMYLYLLLPGG
jgi:hypothetical protein